MKFKVVAIIVLLLLSAFFSSSETAFSSVNRIRLKKYASQGNKRAKKALDIVNSFDKALTALLIGNNIVNIAASSLATVIFIDEFGQSAVGIATLVMTVLVLVFGEILPKSLAKENAEKYSLRISYVLTGLITVLLPLINMFILLKKGIVKVFVKNTNQHPSVTEEELKYIIDEIEDEGVLEEQERDLVKSALEFDEISISDILIPRVNIVGVEVNDDIEEIKDVFIRDKYSRLPVYDKTMDSIIGIIHQKDFFSFYINGEENIRSIIQKPCFFSEHKKISEVLAVMQRTKNHMAIVIDQYGGTDGLVTLEDIIEELVGEIYDENDDEDQDFEILAHDTVKVSGSYSISDMLENLDMKEDTIDTECNSIGGWIMELAEHIPLENEIVRSGIFKINVLKVKDQKIEKVLIHIKNQADNYKDEC